MAIYKEGDVIGQKYDVHRVLGEGGFGVVYLVSDRETKSVYALKTFRDEYLEDTKIKERFRREANVWVNLESHPHLVRAHFVDEFSGRLYIAMAYIAPDEHGRNSLDAYLAYRPPDLVQSLRWAIQFCYGMEYAYSKGIRSHRDIKPANILISQDHTVKIADFGLAGVLGSARATPSITLSVRDGRVGLSVQTMEGAGFGTPTHMAPEQFTNAAECDERSDIYAFGIVLYQMATGGHLPFVAPLPKDPSEEEQVRFWKQMHLLQSESPPPRLESPMSSVIRRCLLKKPWVRYPSFKELRSDLEILFEHHAGEAIHPPGLTGLEASEWIDKGNSLATLNRFAEALQCYDHALSLDPSRARGWYSRGRCLESLCRFAEADRCYDQSLALDPRNAQAWRRKGHRLNELHHFAEALQCYDQALNLNPRHARGWYSRGRCLESLRRFAEASRCYDQSLALDPMDATVWYSQGSNLATLNRFAEALHCYDQGLALDPRNAMPWINKALVEERLGRRTDAVRSYKRFIELAPIENAADVEYAQRRLRALEGS